MAMTAKHAVSMVHPMLVSCHLICVWSLRWFPDRGFSWNEKGILHLLLHSSRWTDRDTLCKWSTSLDEAKQWLPEDLIHLTFSPVYYALPSFSLERSQHQVLIIFMFIINHLLQHCCMLFQQVVMTPTSYFVSDRTHASGPWYSVGSGNSWTISGKCHPFSAEFAWRSQDFLRPRLTHSVSEVNNWQPSQQSPFSRFWAIQDGYHKPKSLGALLLTIAFVNCSWQASQIVITHCQ